MISLSPAPSLPIEAQAECRVYRIGQEEIVKIVVLATKGSFNEKQLSNHFRKATAGLISNLDHVVFGGSAGEDDDGDTELDTGEFVICPDGTLREAADPDLPANHAYGRICGTRVLDYMMEHNAGGAVD